MNGVLPRVIGIQKVHERQAGSDFCIDVQVDVASGHGKAGHIELKSEALLHNEIIELTDCDIVPENESASNQECENAGYKFGDIKTYKIRTYKFTGFELKDDIRLWDEGEGNLYELTASLELAKSTDECCVSFGVRAFGDDGRGRIALNGRTIFCKHLFIYRNTLLGMFLAFKSRYHRRIGYAVIFDDMAHCLFKARLIVENKAGAFL